MQMNQLKKYLMGYLFILMAIQVFKFETCFNFMLSTFLFFAVPSFDKLKKMILLHGGIFHQYYSKTKTNYMIATNLPFAKIKELKEEKIVKPEWLVDCVNQSQLLDYQPYLLYPTKSLKNQPSINELMHTISNIMAVRSHLLW